MVIWPIFLEGNFISNLSPEAFDTACRRPDFGKIPASSMGMASLRSRTGGLTAAACLAVAEALKADVVVTGGLGGVHQGRPHDHSADLHALAASRIPLLCCGFKPFIDYAASLAVLESMMVPVWHRNDQGWPCLYANANGLSFGEPVEDLREMAAAIAAQRKFRPGGAAGLCVLAVPGTGALQADEVELSCSAAIEQAEEKGVCGNALTPWLIDAMRMSLGAKFDLASEAALMNNIVAGIALANMLNNAQA